MENSRHGLAPDVPAGLSAEARSAKAEALAEAGVLVEVRGRRWRLIETRRFDRCSLVTLQGVDRGDIGQTLRVLTPFDRIATRPRKARVRPAGRMAVAHCVADAVLASHPWLGCWTAAPANMTLMPWQLEPALAMLGGITRVLLADAVGLGKTVQAGLILAELAARGLVDRALVLTPAGLRAQWAEELATRFALRATVLDQAALAREAACLPPGVSPWATSPIVISSIDLVKRPEVLAAVDRVPFDLLIVDEAHHATPGSDRGAVVERIARRTPWVVLISATPHSGDEQAFAYLTRLGGGSDTLQIFRRSAPTRERPTRSKLVAVRTSPAEAELLAAVHEYATAIWRDRGVAQPAARLVATVLARRAASSPDSVLNTLTRRQRLLDAGQAMAAPEQASLPWEETDESDADVDDALLSTPGLARADEERRWLPRLIDLAARARGAAAKAAWIERWLARVREPAIVFSEYRDTIEALRARLEPLTSVVTLHGGMPPAARRAATAAFVDGSAMLLLATDTAGEGLNLHARCRTVIDNELPWNPTRLEQRVGRVDRIGQCRPVHAVHLMHAGSIEQTVLAHLHRRVARAATAVTLGPDFDARVAESILGGSPVPSLTRLDWPHHPMSEAVDEVRRLERLRTLARVRQSRPFATAGLAPSVPVAAPRRSQRQPRTNGDPPLPRDGGEGWGEGGRLPSVELLTLRRRILETPMCVVSTEPWMSLSPARVRAKALADFEQSGRQTVTNRETGHRIVIAREGIKNALSHGIGPQKVAVLCALDQLLADGAFVVRDTERLGPGERARETYAGRVSVDAALFVARLVVRVLQDGRRFYDHELSSLEPEVMRGARQPGAPSDAPSSDGVGLPVATSPGKRILHAALASKTTILCAFRVTLTDGHGRTLANAIVPVSAALWRPAPLGRRELVADIERIGEDASLLGLVEATAAEALRPSQLAAGRFERAVRDRVAVVAADLGGEAPLYQPALFDARSTRLATERSAVRAISARHLSRLEQMVRGLEEPTVQPPVLIGAWLEA